MKKETNIYVESEFAPLKRVVLAQSQLILPNMKNTNDNYSFLEEPVIKMLKNKNNWGKDFKNIDPIKQKKWENEREELLKILKKHKVEVLRPRFLTQHEKDLGKDYGAANFFIRDPFFTIGSSLIEGSMRFFHRRKEVLPIREVLINEAYNSPCFYLALPIADTSTSEESESGPFLEGGDVIVLNKTIFVGNSGKASNHNGYLWLKSYLAHWDYEVIEVKLHKDVLHLDCALSLVKDGLMIVCKEAFLDGIPKELQSWDRIDVPFADIEKLAINGLPINEKTYILDQEFIYIGEQLQKHNVTPEYIDFQITRSWGGSFRCSTQPLLRIK